MTKSQLKLSIQKGHGRCFTFLSNAENVNDYRDIVLWGCLNAFAYDQQVEGTRARYLYELTSFFDGDAYFVPSILDALQALPSDEDDKYAHFCEILTLFAQKGSQKEIKEALLRKYAELFQVLFGMDEHEEYPLLELACFEHVAVAIVRIGTEEELWRIIYDIGKLLQIEDTYIYTLDDFEFFYDTIEQRFPSMEQMLEREASKDTRARSFYHSYMFKKQFKARSEASPKAPPSAPISAKKLLDELQSRGEFTIRSYNRFLRESSDGERLKLAHALTQEADAKKRIRLLEMFKRKGFPLDGSYLIKYLADYEGLNREIIFEVMKKTKSDALRSYAVSMIKQKRELETALIILIKNYHEENENLLLRSLTEIYAERDTDTHEIECALLDAFEIGVPLPHKLLLFVYEATLCAHCRERAVCALGARALLTDDIITECLHDSRTEIREYVRAY